jgi:hypothetical protein
MTTNKMTGITNSMGRCLGSEKYFATGFGHAYSMVACILMADITSAGLASLGQYTEQSPQLWHNQTSASVNNLSFRPQEAAIISLRGNGL